MSALSFPQESTRKPNGSLHLWKLTHMVLVGEDPWLKAVDNGVLCCSACDDWCLVAGALVLAFRCLNHSLDCHFAPVALSF